MGYIIRGKLYPLNAAKSRETAEKSGLSGRFSSLRYRFTSSFFMPRSNPSTVSGYISTTLAL